jgi:hypothetical protein
MTDEAIIDLLLFLMVIVMTYQALGNNPLRARIGRHIGRWLAALVAGAVLLPFVLFQGPIFSARWFNPTSQMLTFGGAIVNLALWTALLGNRKRNPLLLAVSAGLGIAVTGAAITFGLHHFRWAANGTARILVDLIKSLAHVARASAGSLAYCEVAASFAMILLTGTGNLDGLGWPVCFGITSHLPMLRPKIFRNPACVRDSSRLILGPQRPQQPRRPAVACRGLDPVRLPATWARPQDLVFAAPALNVNAVGIPIPRRVRGDGREGTVKRWDRQAVDVLQETIWDRL